MKFTRVLILTIQLTALCSPYSLNAVYAADISEDTVIAQPVSSSSLLKAMQEYRDASYSKKDDRKQALETELTQVEVGSGSTDLQVMREIYEFGNIDWLQALMDAGADFDIPIDDGKTALELSLDKYNASSNYTKTKVEPLVLLFLEHRTALGQGEEGKRELMKLYQSKTLSLINKAIE